MSSILVANESSRYFFVSKFHLFHSRMCIRRDLQHIFNPHLPMRPPEISSCRIVSIHISFIDALSVPFASLDACCLQSDKDLITSLTE